jgi:hypothetical protein
LAVLEVTPKGFKLERAPGVTVEHIASTGELIIEGTIPKWLLIKGYLPKKLILYKHM